MLKKVIKWLKNKSESLNTSITMRPDVYPRTLENIKAVLLYYFPKTSHTEIDKNAERVYEQRKFKLNELEHACEIISRNKDVIRRYYRSIDINTFLVVMYDVLFEDESNWGSDDRRKKLKNIKTQIKM